MDIENENKTKEFDELIFTWRIENIRLCFQRNGEALTSPTFTVDWLKESSWNLCLYPNGIQGENDYISYFITQENKNAPMDDIGVKFELYLLAADGTKVHPEVSECFLSMKKNDMLGWSRFISQKTLMKEKTDYLPDETLTLCCRIWCEHKLDTSEKIEPVKLKVFARTRVRKEEITQQMALYPNDSKCQEIGQIRSILQDSPIAEFFATFREESGHKSLTFNIEFKKNEKIKSGFLNLVLINQTKKVYWRTEYVWQGINCEFMLSSELPKTSEQYVLKEMFTVKCLYLLCRFVFTTGSITQKIEKNDYGNNLDLVFAQRLSDSSDTKRESACQTAADALKSLFDDPIYHDVIIKGRNEEFKVHEMILAPRSEWFSKLLSERDETNVVQINNEDDDTLQRVIYFLYTDTILDMHWEMAKRMYKAAFKYKIELLKEKCCEYIRRNISVSNICDLLILTKNEKDSELKGYARDFITKNHSDVFGSVEWKIFSKSNPTLALEYMMTRFKLK
ncbi:Speckle-type POZ protein like [Argiope bruennichi]|uniref:Speckle-type POZ protein like n=1 Tax=Argiope bruennichi TaxID=94029 RepID=A0A8T0F4B4_ARGBR|nr:Speckle-type POZ protein like [Argiope bruennichi]